MQGGKLVAGHSDCNKQQLLFAGGINGITMINRKDVTLICCEWGVILVYKLSHFVWGEELEIDPFNATTKHLG